MYCAPCFVLLCYLRALVLYLFGSWCCTARSGRMTCLDLDRKRSYGDGAELQEIVYGGITSIWMPYTGRLGKCVLWYTQVGRRWE